MESSEPTSIADLESFIGPLPQPTCFDCGTAVVARVGRSCDACASKRALADRRESLRRAWSTVPNGLSWVSFTAPKLAEWVSDGEAIAAARAAIGAKLVTLVGDMRAGKTTLAAAMLREHIRRGARPDAPPTDVSHARRARFVTTYALLREREDTRLGQDHMPLRDVCERASVLVIDELGTARDPHGVLYALLHERHARGRQTIVTTWLSRERCAEQYGGIAGRLFDDGTVIRVRKVTP